MIVVMGDVEVSFMDVLGPSMVINPRVWEIGDLSFQYSTFSSTRASFSKSHYDPWDYSHRHHSKGVSLVVSLAPGWDF